MAGTLHARRDDLERGKRDALAMEALEILLLGALGFANPYREAGTEAPACHDVIRNP